MAEEPFDGEDAATGSTAILRRGAPEELALDLTSEVVRLVARDAGGRWTELGAAPLAGGDFRAALDLLRRQAEARGGLAVTLWLPAGEVLVRRYVLKRGDRTAEALRRIAEDAGRRADALSVALSPAAEGGLVTVLGASKQTIAEAVDYARRWGFVPNRISTRVEAERFGAAGPEFDMPARAERRLGAGTRRALAAAAAALAIGAGAWGAYGLLPASDPAPMAVAVAPVAAAPQPEKHAGLTDAPTILPREEAERPDAGAAPGNFRDGRRSDDGQAPAAVTPPPTEPSAGAEDAPARSARQSAAPMRREAANLAQTSPAAPAADLGALLAGIEQMRAGGAAEPAASPEAEPDAVPEAAPEAAPEEEIVLAASDAAPVTVPARPQPRPESSRAADLADRSADAEEDLVETEGSDTPEPAAQMSDSRLAATDAPRPPARPNRTKRSDRPSQPAWEATTPRMGNAATTGALALDATSLIGVIDANSGREALLRTPSGDFLKVIRGDEIGGWRVSAIGEDAMRLTRGAESRTLLLVTR